MTPTDSVAVNPPTESMTLFPATRLGSEGSWAPDESVATTALSDGEGVGLGVGLGDALALGVGLGDALGLGLGVGLGDGVGLGEEDDVGRVP